MGGSSLCPEVLAGPSGSSPAFPELRIVDSTDPAQVKAACDEVNLAETLVVVASKSGSTLEPNILKQFFFDRMRRAVGGENAGGQFVAITDPGSKMEQVAKADGFRQIFYGDPQIGGRYSALSNFGVVAATAAGLNVEKLLAEAAKARGRRQAAGGGESRRAAWAAAGRGGERADATRSLCSPRRRSPTWAHGWSS